MSESSAAVNPDTESNEIDENSTDDANATSAAASGLMNQDTNGDANIDDRRVMGTENNDEIITGSSDDSIAAQAGDDLILAGLGSDFVEAGAGDDTVFADAEGLTISATDLITMQEDRNISVTFDHEGAGFRNSIGVYKVDPDTGAIYDVEIIWANASLEGSGGDLVAGVSSAEIATSAGDQVGFFLIGNGFNANNFDDFEDGTYEFRNDGGSQAAITDSAPVLVFVHDDGSETQLANPIYHTAAHGDRIGLNPDGIGHTVGLVAAEAGDIRLGFEDLLNGGDNDFDDAVFTVDIGEATATVLNAHFEQNLTEETQALGQVNPDSILVADPMADRVHGEQGSDHLEGMDGNDLLVGDRAGAEWSLVDGEWEYDASMEESGGVQDTHDDVLIGDAGNDVLNGGLGDDHHTGGAGDDRINAGEGRDFADGGTGVDQVNLEDGDDVGYGGRGADIIHAGAGDDIVYGDQGNVLDNGDYGADPHAGIGFSFLGTEGGWSGGAPQTAADNVQTRSVTQTLDTQAGESYSMNFDLALGSLSAQGAASVEIYWNGELIDSIEPGGALFEQYSLSVEGTDGDDILELREVIALDELASEQAVYTTEETLMVHGEAVTVEGFAAGQANLYQVIADELFVFNIESQSYDAIGDGLGVRVNAAGFNAEDGLIYGFATSSGTDALGNDVSKHDLIAIDANGNSYCLGHADFASEIGGGSVYIGDFGPDGDLYVMNGGHRSELFKIDLDSVGADGSVPFESIPLPSGQLKGFADWAWVSSEQAFVGISSAGDVYSIDPFNLVGGVATVTSGKITTTLTDDGVQNGAPSGSAWGAVFTDGDGNLYAGLNNGDHDADGSTASTGGIFQITDFTTNGAQAVLLAEAPPTGSNDGISDPRSLSAFAETDGDASVLIRNVTLTSHAGEDDLITGGLGSDQLYGEGGGDTIHGQEGDDTIDGGVGNDVLFGDAGDDYIYGGEGDDHIEGGAGADNLAGNVGADTLMAGAGNDHAQGGAGADKVVGGAGEDTIEGGAGDDHLWGGEWSADGASDTFVFAQGTGQDMVHDFEAGHDVIDLSAFGLSWEELQPAIQDHGWAVSIELGSVGGEAGDRIFLTNISSNDLSIENFELGG